MHALRRREDGQALIFSVLMLAVLLGVASLVVDGGNALLQRRNQQGVADAAAMAAVRDLPASSSAADAAARSYATTQNSADGSTVDQVVVTGTGSGSCDGGFGNVTLAPESVCVVVHTDARAHSAASWASTRSGRARGRSRRPLRSPQSARGCRSAFAREPSRTIRQRS